MATRETKDSYDWQGPAAKRKRASLLRYAKELFIPPKGHRVVPTSSGMFLILIGLSLGLAAYNTVNNILFAALSLLISSLILSGIICWSNFLSARWRLETSPTFRVGETGEATVVVENARRRFPLYCLSFEVESDAIGSCRSMFLRDRLDIGESNRLIWRFKPSRRCSGEVRISDAVSTFPFGFLRKHVFGGCKQSITVWPKRIQYGRYRSGPGGGMWQGSSTKQKGITGELISLRSYNQGDAPRSIHWKVSARQNRLVVKQNSTENQTYYCIDVDASRYLWSSPELFEKLCSFVASLAEDLFLEGKLDSCITSEGRRIKVNRVSDLETFFDELANLEIEDRATSGTPTNAKNVIVFRPLGKNTVGAFINGNKIAQT